MFVSPGFNRTISNVKQGQGQAQILVANKRFEDYRDTLKQEKAALLDGMHNGTSHYNYDFVEKVLIEEWGMDKYLRTGNSSDKDVTRIYKKRLEAVKEKLQSCKNFIKANNKVFQILEDERMLQEDNMDMDCDHDNMLGHEDNAVTRVLKQSAGDYPRLKKDY